MRPSPESLLPSEFPGGRLRRVRPEDLPAFQAYRSIADLARYQGWSPVGDVEALAFLTKMSSAPMFGPGRWIQLGIAEEHTDRLIGDIGLHLSDDGLTGEVGFTLSPGSQGRGLATAAVNRATQILLASTMVDEILGITDSRNAPSIRLLERLGFRFRETRTVVFKGESCTECVYVLRRSE